MIRIHPDLLHLLTDHEPEPHPDNSNEGDVDEIMESLVVHGCYAPVHVSRASNRMVKGHHLYLALRELGEPRWPIQWHEGMSWEDEVRFMIVDNRTAKLSRTDKRVEAQVLRQLEQTDLRLVGTGYKDHDLEKMIEAVHREDSIPLRFPADTHIPLREDRCPCCGRRKEDR